MARVRNPQYISDWNEIQATLPQTALRNLGNIGFLAWAQQSNAGLSFKRHGVYVRILFN